MNEFERKLAAQPFRAPPPDLRDAILGATAKVIAPACWTWRDWMWPSPRAWAALAALWIVFAALSFHTDETAAPMGSIAAQPSASITFLTLHQARDLDHVLQLPN